MFFKKDKKQRFWSWFVKNRPKIESFLSNKNRTDYGIYAELSKRMKKVDPEIIPELTIEDNSYVLIISCDGISAGIKPVQELAAVAPKIENWIIKKFRQPIDKITLNYKGLQLEVDDLLVTYKLNKDREKVDITYRIRGFDEKDSRYKPLGFLYLDHILGEFNVMTRVGYIDFEELNENESESIGLVELRKVIEQNLY